MTRDWARDTSRHCSLNEQAPRQPRKVPWVSLKGLGLPTTQRPPSIPEESLSERASTTHPRQITRTLPSPSCPLDTLDRISDLLQNKPSKWSRSGHPSKIISSHKFATQSPIRHDLRNDADGSDTRTYAIRKKELTRPPEAHCGT